MFMVLDYYGLYMKHSLSMNFTGFTVSEFDDINIRNLKKTTMIMKGRDYIGRS